MKYANYLILSLVIACVNVAQAGEKRVNFPFANEPIVTKAHEGLIANYNMGRNPNRIVVCELHDFYKGWLEYSRNGEMIESRVYRNENGRDTIILTSKGTVGKDIYHADPTGTVKIKAVSHEKAPFPIASCYYEIIVDNE